jgi:uncharacterized membrane protein (DUF2068 family)
MWRIAAILAVGAIIIVIEAPSLWRNKRWKELWAFAAMLIIGVALCLAVHSKLEVPTPLEWIRQVFEPIGKVIQSL